jgi:adenylosuccinate synthase
LPGWSTDITKALQWGHLPQEARDYITFISEFTRTEVKLIAVGPGRDETIVMP